MREILFRGKRIDNGEWVEGNYYKIPAPPVCFKEDLKTVRDKHYIILENPNSYPDWGMPRQMVQVEVIPETVGQYTGLTDKNGKKIFEGDIVKTWRNTIGKIEFGQYWDEETEEDFYGYAWIGKDKYGESITLSLNKCWNGHEVIGNIHDNPELLEVEK